MTTLSELDARPQSGSSEESEWSNRGPIRRSPQALQDQTTRLGRPKPRRLPKVALKEHPLGRPEDVAIDAYAVCLSEILAYAEGWDCPKGGPSCKNRAHAAELFCTAAEAEAAAPRNARERAARLVRGTPERAFRRLYYPDGPEPLHILHVTGILASCFDYRESGCSLPDPFAELRLGGGDGKAWDKARRDREEFGALSVLLPGRSLEGHLFAFTSACRELKVTSVATVELEI